MTYEQSTPAQMRQGAMGMTAGGQMQQGGLGGIVGGSPNDMWLTRDGAYLYQIYPNASKLAG